MADVKTPTKARQPWTADSTKRVLNAVFSSMWASLPPTFRKGIIAKRAEILESEENDALKSQKLWDLLDHLVIEAGEIAFDRMVAAKERWTRCNKVRDWDHKYQATGQALADKFNNLWALNAEGKVVIPKGDSTLRKVMQAHVTAMFAFTSDPTIWAPLGRCANTECKGFDGLPKPILPDRQGKIHDCCSGDCAKVVHPRVEDEGENLAEIVAGMEGVTLTLASEKGDGRKRARREGGNRTARRDGNGRGDRRSRRNGEGEGDE